ncbi:hypothetical protein DTO280E4_2458 [Paecilomyces variotii]|nr:hypothetical protein DTO280E4_2458 [Paecilomyces variotii]
MYRSQFYKSYYTYFPAFSLRTITSSAETAAALEKQIVIDRELIQGIPTVSALSLVRYIAAGLCSAYCQHKRTELLR